MAKDSKKGKLIEPKISPKDKDIHLNVVGVPPRNVDVKKTFPRQDNEDYQMYKISIDTKGKQKERKRRLSSLEPSPKRAKNSRRPKSNDTGNISSDDSYTQIPRPQKTKVFGRHKETPQSPRSRKKGSVDSEICFTIPGEKGKAIRIVGSSTKPRDGRTSRENSAQRSNAKKTESPRQVGFAKLDEVYGTTPEESSMGSRESMPYRQNSPQVYNMERRSPSTVFKDPKISNDVKGNDERKNSLLNSPPYSNKSLEKQSKPSSHSPRTSSPSAKGFKQDPRSENREPHLGSHVPEYDKPSTSKYAVEKEPEYSQNMQSDHSRSRPANKSVNETSTTAASTSYVSSNYEPSSENSTESKGKYPFYPYDKQKRGKSPSNQFQEPRPSKQEDKEPFQKLPSIQEVRSTEHYPSTHPSRTQGISIPTKESTVLTGVTPRSNEVIEKKSPILSSPKRNVVPTAQPSKRPSVKENEHVLNDEQHTLNIPSKRKKPIDPYEPSQKVDGLTSPFSLTIQKPNDTSKASSVNSPSTQKDNLRNRPTYNEPSKPSHLQKPIQLHPSNTQLGTLGNSPLANGSQKSHQPQVPAQRMSQSTSPMISKIQKSGVHPVVNYNVQSTPSQLETPNTRKQELENKPQRLMSGVRSRTSPLQGSSANRLQHLERPRESVVERDQVAVNKNTPLPVRRPQTVDKEVMTERPLKPKERIMLEINEELSKKSSPLTGKPPQDSVKHNVSNDDKDSKRTRSKLSAFVSSIPKPSFRRNKSLEKKSTDKSVTSDKAQPKLEHAPDMKKSTVNARTPVEESAIMKTAHEPVVEAYPAWVTSPDQQHHENKDSDIQPRNFEDSPMSENNPPKGVDSKEFTPYEVDDSSSVEIANRSYGEHPLANRASRDPTVSEKLNRSVVSDKEKDSPDYPKGQPDISKSVDSKSWKPSNAEIRKRSQNSNSSGSTQHDIDSSKDSNYNNYGKNKTLFDSPNVVAYPGQINEQTPFGYESQFASDPTDNVQSLASLEDGFEASRRLKKDNQDLPRQLVDRNPSLVSRSSRHPDDGSKKELYGHPVQIVTGSTDSKLFPEKQTPKELNHDPNKNNKLKNVAYEHGNKEDSGSQLSNEDRSRSGQPPTNLDGGEVKANHLNDNPFGKTSPEQVYIGNVPNTTYKVFHPEDSSSELDPNEGNPKPTSIEQQGPKGILIFVNKKNETATPFGKSSPSRKGKDYSTKTKNQGGSKKEKKRRTSSSEYSSAISTVQSSYASGDKKAVVERSSSGRKTTETFPCGCMRVIRTDPSNQLKREELISAFCKDGSRCEVSKMQRSLLGRSLESSSISWEGAGSRPDRVFPDIEVIADGVMSRKPIKPKPPAPTMNGAKLTGTFKIKSTKVNGVCNLYLDRKLKNYLRNNMDKIKLLLEDDSRR